eukprot:5077212-Prymnesium_polylepis.5
MESCRSCPSPASSAPFSRQRASSHKNQTTTGQSTALQQALRSRPLLRAAASSPPSALPQRAPLAPQRRLLATAPHLSASAAATTAPRWRESPFPSPVMTHLHPRHFLSLTAPAGYAEPSSELLHAAPQPPPCSPQRMERPAQALRSSCHLARAALRRLPWSRMRRATAGIVVPPSVVRGLRHPESADVDRLQAARREATSATAQRAAECGSPRGKIDRHLDRRQESRLVQVGCSQGLGSKNSVDNSSAHLSQQLVVHRSGRMQHATSLRPSAREDRHLPPIANVTRHQNGRSAKNTKSLREALPITSYTTTPGAEHNTQPQPTEPAGEQPLTLARKTTSGCQRRSAAKPWDMTRAAHPRCLGLVPSCVSRQDSHVALTPQVDCMTWKARAFKSQSSIESPRATAGCAAGAGPCVHVLGQLGPTCEYNEALDVFSQCQALRDTHEHPRIMQ